MSIDFHLDVNSRGKKFQNGKRRFLGNNRFWRAGGSCIRKMTRDECVQVRGHRPIRFKIIYFRVNSCPRFQKIPRNSHKACLFPKNQNRHDNYAKTSLRNVSRYLYIRSITNILFAAMFISATIQTKVQTPIKKLNHGAAQRAVEIKEWLSYRKFRIFSNILFFLLSRQSIFSFGISIVSRCQLHSEEAGVE